jgi:cobaltochelatase CobT
MSLKSEQIKQIENNLNGCARAVASDASINIMLQGGGKFDALAANKQVYLKAPNDLRDLSNLRLLADRFAFVRAAHNQKLHLHGAPVEMTNKVIYDDLELLRVELFGSKLLDGSFKLIYQKFCDDCAESGYEYLSERADPPLRDILRALILKEARSVAIPNEIARLTSLWQPFIMREAGAQIENMLANLHNQHAFKQATLQLINRLAKIEKAARGEMSEDEGGDIDLDSNGESGDENESQREDSGDGSAGENSDNDETDVNNNDGVGGVGENEADLFPQMGQFGETVAGSLEEINLEGAPVPQMQNQPQFKPQSYPYIVFTKQYDEVIMAEKLASHDELLRLRLELDRKLKDVQGSFSKLAIQLQRLLMTRQQQYWQFGLEEGLLNSATLSQLVSNPSYHSIFKQEIAATDVRDTVVTLLLDNSGSMRGRPITIAAICSDILTAILERAGVKVEILGFTTKEWKGGKSYKQWVQGGKVARPGRLNDIRHIVYKSAEMPLSKAKRNIAVMLKEGLLKENIDGEALLWAHNRLRLRPESRRILMIISDGAPVDDATLSANHAGYLDRHLRQVISQIEADKQVELLAIGIGHDVTRYYKRSICLRDVSRLGETMTKELVKLFSD